MSLTIRNKQAGPFHDGPEDSKQQMAMPGRYAHCLRVWSNVAHWLGSSCPSSVRTQTARARRGHCPSLPRGCDSVQVLAHGTEKYERSRLRCIKPATKMVGTFAVERHTGQATRWQAIKEDARPGLQCVN